MQCMHKVMAQFRQSFLSGQAHPPKVKYSVIQTEQIDFYFTGMIGRGATPQRGRGQSVSAQSMIGRGATPQRGRGQSVSAQSRLGRGRGRGFVQQQHGAVSTQGTGSF